MKTSYSVAVLPGDMPLVSFLAYYSNSLTYGANNPIMTSGWSTTSSASHGAGVHLIDADFNGSVFTVRRAGVYYCVYRQMTYGHNGPANLEVELRINQKRDPGSIGYGRHGIASSSYYTSYFTYQTTVMWKLNVGDTVSAWVTSDTDTSWVSWGFWDQVEKVE